MDPEPLHEKLIIISAPSGAGKTTIVKHLLHTYPELGFSVSATSRPLRKGEEHGREYYFLTAVQFQEKIRNGELLEWQEVYPGSYYGSLKSEVNRILKEGKIPVFDVDVVGGVNIKKMYGRKAFSIFIQPPSLEILEERLRTRGTENEESLKKRIAKAAWEMGFAPQFDTILINDILQNTLREAEKIIHEYLNKKP